MKIDVMARAWGSPTGGSNGMAIAAAFLAHTLRELGHDVRQVGGYAPGAELVITTISQTWRRTLLEAAADRALDRLVYWHHAGGVPADACGRVLAAPPAIAPHAGWSRHVVLPPSSWAVEAAGDCIGDEILVGGAGPAKGGHVALAVARRCPDLRWYVLQGRSSPSDRAPWSALRNAQVAPGVVAPDSFLPRARALLAPTRFDVHPLLLVEAAVRGIPIVCSDLPATRAAAGEGATFLPVTAPADAWENALRAALERPVKKLRLRPYADVVSDALGQMQHERAAA